MAEDPPQSLPIRCPDCGQRFKVGPELLGRVVECGSCDHRFRVDDHVIQRQKKHYPGERRDPQLDRFSRIPREITAVPPQFQQVHYTDKPAPSIEGFSPIRLVAGAAAAAIICLLVCLLLFGNSPGGSLDGMPMAKQIGLALFGSVIASLLIFASSPDDRKRAGLFSLFGLIMLISSATLVKKTPMQAKSAVPVKTARPEHKPGADAVEDLISDATGTDSGKDPYSALRDDLKIDPLDQEIARLAASGSDAKVLGVYVDDLKDYDKLLVRDYLVRVTQANPNCHPYSRGNAYLYVLSDVKIDLPALAKLCERFAEVEAIVDPLHLVRVKLKPDVLVEGASDKLTDQKSPEFYDLNRLELECIDLGRSHRAVSRLASVEPKLYRKDIVKRLQQLLLEGQPDMLPDIANCLDIWAEPNDDSAEFIHKAIERLQERKASIPKPLVAFMVHRKDPYVLPVLNQLWLDSPVDWEVLYQEMGSAISKDILRNYPSLNISLKYSAIKLLGNVGTAEAIPVLTQDRPGVSQELKGMIDNSLAQIKSRQ